MAITTRETTATGVTNKGSPLTNAEVDTNFIELQQDKIELTDLSVTTNSAGTAALTYTNTTGVFTYTPPDLSGYLTSEANDLTASVTWANVPDANITQSSVTQHQAALSITESQISDLGSYIELADLSVGAEGAASGDGSISYDNTTGVFTYTPPADISGAVTFAAKAGEALTKGDVVYVSGVSGNTPVVSKADANDASKMPAYGLAEADASLNAAVNVITFGTLYNLDTSGFSAGDTVYVSTTAGAITSTAPTGESSLLQNIGTVIRSHASAGSIKVGGAGRTNATPNLNDGNVFIGNGSNQAVARALTGDDISGGTITSFASTGIDDNATSTAITIDASENVGIGTASPSTSLDVVRAGAMPLRVQSTSGTECQINMVNTGGNVQLEAHSGNFTIDADNVGIGTTSPSSKLHVRSSSSGASAVADGTLVVEQGSAPSIQILSANTQIQSIKFGDPQDGDVGKIDYSHSDDSFRFITNATERMRIDSSGRVGIGVSSPAEMLDINEGSTATYIRMRNATSTTGYIGYGTSASATDMTFWTNGSKQVTLDGSGNVGIGTTAPGSYHSLGSQLVVAASGDAGMTIASGTANDGRIFFADGTSGSAESEGTIRYDHSDNSMHFSTADTVRLSLDSSGNVGIGTTSPEFGIHYVSGTSGNTSVLGSGDELALESSSDVGMTFRGGTGNYATMFFAFPSDTYRGYIQYGEADDTLRFGTAKAERMRISSNGQLKIGGTTNSPANVQAVLFGTGNASVLYDTGHTGLHINNENATAGLDNYGAGISFGRFASNSDDQSAAIVPVQTTADQDHMGIAFLTHDTNTRANPVVEKMRLDADGNLGLGTDDPSRLLHLKAADSCLLQLEVGNTTGNCQILFGDSGSTTVGKVLYYHSGNALAFETNSAERMRIDSVGNLGIGNTSPSTIVGNISGSATGLAIESAVPVFALKDTSASDDISYIYQSTNDMRFLNYAGGEMTFRRGSGGTESMRIDSSGHLITPNGVTLGTSAGVYNAANTLDDYEEGSWNPSLQQGSATVSGARYVKVGRLVYVEALLTAFTNRSTAAEIQVGNLPFTSSSDCRAGNVSLSRFINRSSGTIVSYLGSSRNYAHFYAIVTNADYQQVYHSHLSSSSSNLYISITYEATS